MELGRATCVGGGVPYIMSRGGGRGDDDGDNAKSNPSMGEVGARLQAGRRTRGLLLGEACCAVLSKGRARARASKG